MSLKDARTEVLRELDMRRKKYPAWIQSGLLNRDLAEKQIKRMELVSTLLDAMNDKEFATLLIRAAEKTNIIQGSLNF